ncbi:hypothetical protein [Rubinisphaera sp.]|uniref:hypothetical protein n=1 Tax=Rubinisphaera sp. TaxID=2024857 RepID=UPI000C1208A8|nr:hypothetical protein [Rubinisphaera sp.]MBV09418.1 hypothetical protein [Rubinisphaera sp.]
MESSVYRVPGVQATLLGASLRCDPSHPTIVQYVVGQAIATPITSFWDMPPGIIHCWASQQWHTSNVIL